MLVMQGIIGIRRALAARTSWRTEQLVREESARAAKKRL
jgi:hypothetical protein